jgi:hypothetical protein
LVASQVVAPDDHAVMAASPPCRQVHRSPKEVHGIPDAVSYRALGFLQQATQLS